MTDIGGGGAVIAWTDTRDTDPRIYAQYVSSAGTCIWAVNGIKATTSVTDQEGVDITTLGTTAVLAFTNNPGSSSLYISCQRLSLSGARIWGSSGIRVSYEDGHQILPQVTPDEDGGVLVAWTEFTAIDDRIHAQRLTAAGDRHWTSNGALVNDYAGEKGGPRVWADGEGGCLLSWVDTRHYLGSIYAQRLDANGMRRWHEDGVQMSGTTLYEDHQSLRDDRGGLIAVWGDDREGSDSVNIYAQRMHATGYLADPQPVMTEVSDFPNDQGGRALVTWDRCYLDAWPWTAVESYSVWVREAEVKRPKILDYENCTNLSRHLGMSPETLAEMGRDGWTFVDDVPAVLEPVYSCAAFTFGDSTSAGIPMAEYRVLAHSDNPAIFWESEPMFGYSVDNLAPGAPLALNGLSQGQGEVLLTWSASGHHDEDLSHYVVYRGAEPDVPQDPDHQVGTTVELTFIDPSGSGTWFYQVTAMDVHENESEGSNEIQVEVTSSDAPEVTGLPLNLALHVRGPNPFVEQTTLAFDLPEECEVDLLVCSVDGRRVARLVQGVHPAGRHRVSWRGRDADGRDLPPGVYFARMRVGSSTYRVRLAHVR
ncbi:MAG: hypothetical protein KJ927_11270, partial [Candidatus Eisenbacteria bacterium]|nr:hypothetical protein [Candidatus Eisenbacteria bacterium]